MRKTLHPSKKELLLYLDGELEEGSAREVSRHLPACESCSAQLEEIKQASESLATVQDQILRPAWVSSPVDWPDASELMFTN